MYVYVYVSQRQMQHDLQIGLHSFEDYYTYSFTNNTMNDFQLHYDAAMVYATDTCSLSHRMIFTIAVVLIHFIAFYLHAWIFVLADWYGFLDHWAIRSGKHRLPSATKQWEAIRDGSLDAMVIKPLLVYFIYPVAEGFISFGTMPSFTIGFLHWIAMEVIFSTSLFWIHGAMHYFPSIYKLVHKKHHTFYETVAFAAQYSHPLEGIASSTHIILSIIIVRPHFIVLCAYLTTTFIEIVDSHCGYDVPWAILYPWSDRYPWGAGARAHDYHHSKNIGMYGGGLIGLWDKLFGTDRDFCKYEEERRQRESTHRIKNMMK